MKTNVSLKKCLIIILFIPITIFSQRNLPIQKDFPLGKKGEVLKTFIEVINSQKNEVELLNTNSSKKNRNEVSEQIYELKALTGGITFKGIFKSRRLQENQTILIIEDKNYTLWRGISITFDNKTDYNIESFSQRLFPKQDEEREISSSKMIKIISKRVKKLADKDLFSGAVLVAKGNEILYKKAFGEASKRYHIANNLDTKFNIASVGKMFTGVSIMQLKEKGKLKIENTIDNYIAESWLPKEISKQITIHHLLTHTSGLGNYFNEKFINSSKENFRNINDFKSLIVNDTLKFEPGKGYYYSNIGVLLLGVIIEKLSGLDYETYIKENIHKPSNMTNSGFFDMDEPVENLAIGYIKTRENKYGWKNNLFKHVIKGGPAGGGFSTVTDLYNFMLALKNEKLVSKQSLELLWKRNTPYRYGYCFEVKNTKIGKQVGHSGGFAGINSEVIYDTSKDYISVVLSNYETGINTSNFIRELLNRVED
ncbi:serine hydrolase domain-containing protein [Polaribacter porphyrae]|uniref:Beta-lactamase-related domain-containing protein n=1 Tax=Polaribacter porphyrae TaxID=1137780 RepID=A0A2S7WKV7_9FLAO|nr:serine hydrolase domain-containing protein [Polaribacter porphyrae]PQJ78240.1 hypothetical protein BTO18_03110 [Polaribacter porphyrae]